MINFNIVNGKVIIDPETLTVGAFNDIWEYDSGKGSNKPKASNMLTYIFHMCDYRDKNPFRDVATQEKEALAKRNAFGNQNHKFSEKEQKLIDRAMAWYDVLNKNSVQRLSISLDRKIDEVSQFLDDPMNKITTSEQLDEQTTMMVKIEKLINSKQKTDAFVREEMNKVKIKGNTERSPLQAGLLD